MSRDLGSPRQNKRLEQLDRQREEQDDEALRRVMSDEDGRRVLSRLARDFGWMGDGWDASSARLTDHNAGRRSAARQMMAWAERVSPEQFMAALGEATRRDADMALLAKAATMEKEQDDA
jgi:phosphatidylserine/phosphatidylglycerophosphate/cardiolipin synthase-like enzyme